MLVPPVARHREALTLLLLQVVCVCAKTCVHVRMVGQIRGFTTYVAHIAANPPSHRVAACCSGTGTALIDANPSAVQTSRPHNEMQMKLSARPHRQPRTDNCTQRAFVGVCQHSRTGKAGCRPSPAPRFPCCQFAHSPGPEPTHHHPSQCNGSAHPIPYVWLVPIYQPAPAVRHDDEYPSIDCIDPAEAGLCWLQGGDEPICTQHNAACTGGTWRSWERVREPVVFFRLPAVHSPATHQYHGFLSRMNWNTSHPPAISASTHTKLGQEVGVNSWRPVWACSTAMPEA